VRVVPLGTGTLSDEVPLELGDAGEDELCDANSSEPVQ
jgi:hypothetical protein